MPTKIPNVKVKYPKFVAPIQTTPQGIPSPQEANDDAFYSAALYNNGDPVSEFRQAKEEILSQGISDYVEAAKTKLEAENNITTKQTLVNLINDPSVAQEQKRQLLLTYTQTGFVPPNLQEKYLESQAAEAVPITPGDVNSQELVLNTLEQRKQQLKTAKLVDHLEQGQQLLLRDVFNISNLKYLSPFTNPFTRNILNSIPAGLYGIYKSIVDADPQAGADVAARIQERLRVEPVTKFDKIFQEEVGKILEFISIPSEYIGNKILETTNSPFLATAGELLLDPLNLPLGATAAKVIRKVTPKVPATSPLKTTEVANPVVAATVAKEAVKDSTEELAQALGTDHAAIVNDYVHSKLIDTPDLQAYPDIIANLKADEAAAKDLYNYYRYDPNVLDATAREADLEIITKTLGEARGSYLNTASSKINITDNLVEGVEVYGRNNTNGYATKKEANAAFKEHKKAVEQLPEELRGTSQLQKINGEWFITRNYKKEYDFLETKIFGPDSLNVELYNPIPLIGPRKFDITGLARSKIGNWFFASRFDNWVEKAAARGIERTAVLDKNLIRILRDRLVGSKELGTLIERAEKEGRDKPYTKAEISAQFTNASTKKVDEIYRDQIYWKHFNDISYNFVNRQYKNNLTKEGFQGIYAKDGTFLEFGKKDASIPEGGVIYDFKTNTVVPVTKELLESQADNIVKLKNPIRDGENRYNYAILKNGETLNVIPNEVLPRLPGYSPRVTKENFYVDIVPRKLNIDGKTIVERQALTEYKNTIAAARTEAEGVLIKERLAEKYPDHDIVVRPERIDSPGKVINDFEVHQELFRHSLKRGDALPRLDEAPARLEDRLHSLINNTKRIARTDAYRAYDEKFQSNFVEAFPEYVRQGEFPRHKSELIAPRDPDAAEAARFATAQRLFEYYANLKNFETYGDHIWKRTLFPLADILEKWKISAPVGDKVRALGREGNLLVKYPKLIATTNFIHLNPIRQWIVQPAQLLELYAINPQNFHKNIAELTAIRTALATDTSLIKSKPYLANLADGIKKAADKISLSKDFDKKLEAIKRSGILESVDYHTLIDGVFKDFDKALDPSLAEKAYRGLTYIPKTGIKVSRQVGFDAAELTNKIGTWLQVRDLFEAKYPGRNWQSKEALEEIANETFRITGSMNRAGNFAYQQGAASVFFQFAAINHKLLLNTIQDNAVSILSGKQKAAIAAVRLGLYGVKYGLPGYALVEYVKSIVDSSDDPTLLENYPILERGLSDYAVNGLVNALLPDADGNKSDIRVGNSVSPYNEYGLPHLQLIAELAKTWDNLPNTDPRFPSLGLASTLSETVSNIHGWFTVKPVNAETFKQVALEAGEFASGLNNYGKALFILGTRDKVNKFGRSLGAQFTEAEAYAKIGGLTLGKEEEYYKAQALIQEHKADKKELAAGIYKNLTNIRLKTGDESYDLIINGLKSYMTIIDSDKFSEQDKADVIEEVFRLDQQRYVSGQASIFLELFKQRHQDVKGKLDQVIQILERSSDPKIKATLKSYKERTL